LISNASAAIKYPEHDLHSRRVIWRKFFELAGVKTEDPDGSGHSTPTDMVKLDDPAKVATISDAELDVLAEKPFNGRTIKNLVRTAQALAMSSCVAFQLLKVGVSLFGQERAVVKGSCRYRCQVTGEVLARVFNGLRGNLTIS
jgi:hypothetical protein